MKSQTFIGCVAVRERGEGGNTLCFLGGGESVGGVGSACDGQDLEKVAEGGPALHS